MYKLKNKTSMTLTIQGNTVMGKGTLDIKIVDPQVSDLMQRGIIKVIPMKTYKKEKREEKESKKKNDKNEDNKDNKDTII